MVAYTLAYNKPAVKDIQKLPPHIKKRLKARLEWFIDQANPLEFAEPLTEPADAQYRFRVGVYRVLFDIETSDIVILHVQHRSRVYRR